MFEFGDIIATRSGSFLSDAIRFFMRLYKKSKNTFSHNAVAINLWGEVWIAEALAWGVRVWSLDQSGYATNKQTIILRHKKGFTKEQIDTMSKKVVSLSGVRYQYENLPQWMIKILLKINIFRKKNEKSIYCSELAATAINSVYPDTFPTPNMTSPADIIACKDFYILDPNNIYV